MISHLSDKDVPFARWNLGKVAKKYIGHKYNCPLNTTKQDKANDTLKFKDYKYLAKLLYLFNKNEVKDPKEILQVEPFNWETNSIGTWITKNYQTMKSDCFNLQQNLNLEHKINDFFTVEGEVVSLLDASQIYTALDVAALVAEVSRSEIPFSKQYDQYLFPVRNLTLRSVFTLVFLV